MCTMIVIESYDNETELIQKTNDSSGYGLSASVFTRNRKKGRKIASQIRTGAVNINDVLTQYGIADLPFGGVGKSGIDFGKKLAEKYDLPTEPKPVQIGVRFEAPQKHFQKLIDISYDFKLYKKFDNVSLRSFCTNNNAAYVAVEQTYGDVSYNGHARKDEAYRNDMTKFGILMEIRGIDKPFDWS